MAFCALLRYDKSTLCGNSVCAVFDPIFHIEHRQTAQRKYGQWCRIDDLAKARPTDRRLRGVRQGRFYWPEHDEIQSQFGGTFDLPARVCRRCDQREVRPRTASRDLR